MCIRDREKIVAELYRSLISIASSACPKYNEDTEIFGAAYNRSIETLVLDLISGKFRGEAAITTYFRKTMQNNCINEKKKIAGKNHSPYIPEVEESSHEEQYIKSESRAVMAKLVKNAYDKFGDRCKEIFQ